MSETRPRRRNIGLLAAIAVVSALLVFLVAALLTSIFERRQEARNPYMRLVEVNEETTDPAAWRVNWPREYNDYQRTAEQTKTRFGGSESLPTRRRKRFPGSRGCSPATRSRSTIAIAAATPTCSRIRNRPGA